MIKLKNIIIYTFLLVLFLVPNECMATNRILGDSISNAVQITFEKTYHKEWNDDTALVQHFYNKIVVPQNGIVTFHMTKPIDTLTGGYKKLTFDLYDGSYKKIWEANTANANQLIDYYEYKIVLAPGIYYFDIPYLHTLVAKGKKMETDYYFSFKSSEYTEEEPNDTIESANKIELDKEYIGYANYDHDYFKFYVKSNTKYIISIGNYNEIDTSKTLIHLIDTNSSEKSISFKYDGTTGEYSYTFLTDGSGYYYLKIFNNPHDPIRYTIKVKEKEEEKEDEKEDEGDKNVNTGGHINNAVNILYDKTYYKTWNRNNTSVSKDLYNKITVPQDGIVTFHMTKPINSSTGKYQNVKLELYDELGNKMWTADTSKANIALDYYEYNIALSKGTYYLNIPMHLYFTSQVVVNIEYYFNFTATEYAENEPNNTFKTAREMKYGKEYVGWTTSGDIDYLKFYLKAGEEYILSADNFEEIDDSTAIIKLIDPSNQETSIKYQIKYDLKSDSYRYKFIPNESGFYYLKIYNCSSYIRYNFKIEENLENKIILNKENLFMKKGNIFQLQIVPTTSNITSTLNYTWSSNNENVVKVDQKGTLTAISNGTAIISVEYNGKVAKCTVTVKNFMNGDMDHNDNIEIFDVMELLYIVSGKKESLEETIQIGDLDNNGNIDIFDVMELLYIYTGKKL